MKLISTIKSIPTVISRSGNMTTLLMKKHSPEILIGVGIVGGVTAAVLACKATRKVDDILDDHNEAISQIATASTLYEEDSAAKKEISKEKSHIYLKTAKELVKIYAPPVTLGVASIGCILGGHNILHKRNIAIAAAYSVVQDRFNEYRSRVRDEFGEEKDKNLYFGTHQEKVTDVEVDEKTGKKKKINKTMNVLNPNGYSQYARFFDDGSPNWVSDAELNLAFLRAQQNYVNDLLHARGHVFLNEVYDLLGIPRTQAGAVVGWVLSEDGDNFVDFGIYSICNQEAIDFVNGYEQAILLDFNVDGLIYDLI